MRLVLTSGGISNESIKKELRSILGRNFDGLKMLFCTTASNYDGGNMNDWLIEDLQDFKSLGFQIDVCDINGASIERFLPRFEWADVFYFEGGNAQWLMHSIQRSGLRKHLGGLLKTRVWIGASAGSCVLCPTTCNACQDLFDEKTIASLPTNGLGFVDFQFIPHMNSEWFPRVQKANLLAEQKKLTKLDGKKLYAVDDAGAVFVNGEDIKIISEGDWLEA